VPFTAAVLLMVAAVRLVLAALDAIPGLLLMVMLFALTYVGLL